MKNIILASATALLLSAGIANAEAPFGTTDPATDWTAPLVEQEKSPEVGSSFDGFELNKKDDAPRGNEGYDVEAPFNIAH